MVTADDVVRCLQRPFASAGTGDQVFWLFQDLVEGANACLPARRATRPYAWAAVEAVDEHTVRLTLTHPSPDFLQTVAHSGCWIYPGRALTAYGDDLMQHAIGTGPFSLKLARPGETMVLERNAALLGTTMPEGRQLPYLDGVRVTFGGGQGRGGGPVPPAGGLSMHRRTAAHADGRAHRCGGQDHGEAAVPDPVGVGTGRAVLRVQCIEAALQRCARAPRHRIGHRPAASWWTACCKGFAVKAESWPGGAAAWPVIRTRWCRASCTIPTVRGTCWRPPAIPDGKGFPRIQLQLNNDGFGYVRVAAEVQSMLQRELNVAVSVSVLAGEAAL